MTPARRPDEIYGCPPRTPEGPCAECEYTADAERLRRVLRLVRAELVLDTDRPIMGAKRAVGLIDSALGGS
jgi:hypothetical protein